MRFSDMSIGVALVCLALAIILTSATFPSVPGQPYGPGLFPILIGIGLAVCGLALVGQSWGRNRAFPLFTAPPWTRSVHLAGAFLLSVASVVFYIAVVDWLGFVPTAFMVLAVLFIWMRGRPASSLFLAAAVTAAAYASFFYLLSVPLPAGILLPSTG